MSDMNFNRSPVVAVGCGSRNKQNFTFISFNAGTVKCKGIYSKLDNIYTPSLTSY